VIDFMRWKRARLGGMEKPPICRRARPTGCRVENSPASIGAISAEILRKLTE